MAARQTCTAPTAMLKRNKTLTRKATARKPGLLKQTHSIRPRYLGKVELEEDEETSSPCDPVWSQLMECYEKNEFRRPPCAQLLASYNACIAQAERDAAVRRSTARAVKALTRAGGIPEGFNRS